MSGLEAKRDDSLQVKAEGDDEEKLEKGTVREAGEVVRVKESEQEAAMGESDQILSALGKVITGATEPPPRAHTGSDARSEDGSWPDLTPAADTEQHPLPNVLCFGSKKFAATTYHSVSCLPSPPATYPIPPCTYPASNCTHLSPTTIYTSSTPVYPSSTSVYPSSTSVYPASTPAYPVSTYPIQDGSNPWPHSQVDTLAYQPVGSYYGPQISPTMVEYAGYPVGGAGGDGEVATTTYHYPPPPPLISTCHLPTYDAHGYCSTGIACNNGSANGLPARPKRKRVATVPQRKAANVRERKRMVSLNSAFDSLRKKLPTFAYEKKLSRIETLKLSLMYISFMSSLLNDYI